MATDYQIRRDIVRFGAMLHSLGFIAATDGNISVRLDQARILVTPTGMSKGMMTPSDLVVVDMNGGKVKGKHVSLEPDETPRRADVVDLMERLRQSLGQAKASKASPKKAARKRSRHAA